MRNEPPILLAWVMVARAPIPPPRTASLSIPTRALTRQACSFKASTRCSRLRRRMLGGTASMPSGVASFAPAGGASGFACAGGGLAGGPAVLAHAAWAATTRHPNDTHGKVFRVLIWTPDARRPGLHDGENRVYHADLSGATHGRNTFHTCSKTSPTPSPVAAETPSSSMPRFAKRSRSSV